VSARQRWLRLVFVVLLGGGLFWIARGRPRELPLEIELGGADPAALAAVDLVVWREGTALVRVEQRFGAGGAPDLLHAVVRSPPGPAEVELTLLEKSGGARRSRTQVVLAEEPAARVHAQ
jgi:hypothetical protein